MTTSLSQAPIPKNNHFERFLEALDEHLYNEGWYVAVSRIRARNLSTFEEVINYLHEHCYSKTESEEIVYKIMLQTL